MRNIHRLLTVPFSLPFTMRGAKRLSTVALCLGVTGAVLLPSVATAKPKASVSWSPTHRAREGAPIPYTWTARRLGRNAKLVIQRPVGTARTWKTLTRLRGNSGSGALPGVSLGKYHYRLAALKGRRVLASQVAGVGVFGRVSFSVLFHDGYLASGDLDSGVYATPSTSFPYIGSTYIGERGNPITVFSVSHNRCSAVHVSFVLGETPGEGYHNPSLVYGIVTVVQQSRDSVASEVPLNGIGSVDTELVPRQTWSMLAVEDNRAEDNFGSVYFNGYAICDSAQPFDL